MSELSEMLTQANTDGWSTQRITDRARDLGYKISKDTVWKYMRGRHPAVTSDYYLRAFVAVFPSLRLSALVKAAGVAPDLGEWTPPTAAHTLNKKERQALETIIKAMAREKASQTTGLRSVPTYPDPQKYNEAAAETTGEASGADTTEQT